MANPFVVKSASETQLLLGGFAGAFTVLALASYFGLEPGTSRNIATGLCAFMALAFGCGSAANGRLKRDASL